MNSRRDEYATRTGRGLDVSHGHGPSSVRASVPAIPTEYPGIWSYVKCRNRRLPRVRSGKEPAFGGYRSDTDQCLGLGVGRKPVHG
jgi:hypothetical protein